MSIANARLGIKLLILSSVGLLGCVLIAAVGFFGLISSQDTERFLAEDAVPSLKLTASINDQISNMRDAQLSAALARSPTDVNSEAVQFREAMAKVAPLLAAYEKAIDNEEERALFQKVTALIGAYRASAEATLADAKAADPARVEELQRFARVESGNAFDVAGDAIDALSQFNEKAVAVAHVGATTANTSARWALGGLTLLVTVAVAGFAVLITRAVLKQLGGEPGTAVDIANGVAAGDLRQSIAVSADDTGSLMAALHKMQTQLAATVLDVRHHAEGVATASVQIAQGNKDLSSRTEQQASALEETASTTEQLRTTVNQNAENARRATQLAQGASTVAVDGGALVDEVVETMKGIDESSKRIVDIIAVIDGIAFQTNILALNAAVEAARAGDHGRGFAVVASEVRTLAQRSAGAAKEIKTLISTSVDRVERGSALVGQAGSTMRELVASVRSVSELMGDISAANAEQSASLSQVSDAVSQMDRSTQQNSALVEESAAASESLRDQAEKLVMSVASFQVR